MDITRFNSDHYQQELQVKVSKIQQLFLPYYDKKINVFSSPCAHFRLRAEFRIWHEGDRFDYVVFDKKTKQRVAVENFLPASQLINEYMPLLKSLLNQEKVLKHKLFQIDFLSTLQGELLISLLYHKPLDDLWLHAVQEMIKKIDNPKVSFIGRARKTKIVISKEYVNETLKVQNKFFYYKQYENAFSQPNGVVAQKMLSWAVEIAKKCEGDLLELYCGNGNFTVPLSFCFNKVLATEISKSAVNAAKDNLMRNQVDNVEVVKLSAEELSQAFLNVRFFRRLAHLDLKSYCFNTIFLDPPRAGIDDIVIDIAKRYQHIIYISCNPDTLFRDYLQLKDMYDIKEMALFDQFVYSDHIEVGLYLTRRV